MNENNENMDEHEIFRKFLKSEGLRFTPERAVILEEAFSIHEHFEAEDLLFSTRRHGHRVSKATGSVAGMNAALELVAPCGRILLLGDYDQARADFLWNHLLHREMELIGSNASAGAWPEAVRLAVEGDLPLDRLITHRIPAKQFREGIELMRSHRHEGIKVVFEWQ
jgi:threonine dehydrogenase-like Zn-dependent dehydrogenase